MIKEMNFYLDLLKSLNDLGLDVSPRDKKVKELVDVKCYVKNHEALFSLPGIRDSSDSDTKEGEYLRAEFVWYMSGFLTVEFISYYGSMWNHLTNQVKIENNDDINTQINSNYGFHVFFKSPTAGLGIKNPLSQFDWIVNELKKDRSSRKAIMQYTWPIIYLDGIRDFTCTQTQHFLIRNEKLINLVNIRSSDAIKGLTFDIPWWDFVGQAVGYFLGVDSPELVVNIGSSHFYDSDSKLVNSILDNASEFKTKKLLMNTPEHISNNFDSVYKYMIKYYSSCYDEMLKNEKDNFEPKILDVLNNSKQIDFNNINCIDLIKYLCNMHVGLFTNLKTYVNKKDISDINNKIFDLVFRIMEA